MVLAIVNGMETTGGLEIADVSAVWVMHRQEWGESGQAHETNLRQTIVVEPVFVRDIVVRTPWLQERVNGRVLGGSRETGDISAERQ
jgi:hypothetical protein